MTGTTLNRPAPGSLEPGTGSHVVARTLADTAASMPAASSTPTTPAAPCPTATAAAAEQACRDGECVAFFVSLVTAAVVILGLALFTQIEGLPRLLLTAAAGLPAGVITWSMSRPALEDELPHD